MTIEPFDGEVWDLTLTLNDPDSKAPPCTVTMSVVVEQLPESEMTMERMDAQEEAVYAAAMDRIRPFLNNRTYFDVAHAHTVRYLSDVPVVKRAGT